MPAATHHEPALQPGLLGRAGGALGRASWWRPGWLGRILPRSPAPEPELAGPGDGAVPDDELARTGQ